MRYYGARPPSFRAAPKPANFEALSAAAAAGDTETFAREYDAYRAQCNTAGIHPGTLIGHLHDNGDLS